VRESVLHRSTEAHLILQEHHQVMAEVDRIDAGTTWVTYEGPPFVDPTIGRYGSFVDICLSLNEAELVQLCGYWEWRADLAERDIDRWWCWTVVRFGRGLLASRGGPRQRRRQPS
jgi:hypothetical protein